MKRFTQANDDGARYDIQLEREMYPRTSIIQPWFVACWIMDVRA